MASTSQLPAESSAPTAIISKPTHLTPSELGTKEYWDSLYNTELRNNTLNPSDVGTIWFDDSSAEEKVLSFLESTTLALNKTTSSFLDVGTGNGHFLLRLREGGSESDEEDEEDCCAWEGRMLGTDYSQQSIEFAQRLAVSRNVGPDAGTAEIEFVRWDILRSPYEVVLTAGNKDGWDVVLDKGTFDAISLSEERDGQGRRVCEGYKERVVPLIRKGGYLVITSCNWTTEELRGWFEDREELETGLAFVSEIEYKRFAFGGVVGQSVSSVCFQKGKI